MSGMDDKVLAIWSGLIGAIPYYLVYVTPVCFLFLSRFVWKIVLYGSRLKKNIIGVNERIC